MDAFRAILGAIGTAIIVVILVLLAIFLTVGLGYFLGYILTITPFVSGWLTTALPITVAQIPSITAWMAVLTLFIGTGARANKTNE